MAKFRIRVAARRQMTLPQELLRELGIEEGDVLEIDVKNGMFVGRALKLLTQIYSHQKFCAS